MAREIAFHLTEASMKRAVNENNPEWWQNLIRISGHPVNADCWFTLWQQLWDSDWDSDIPLVDPYPFYGT